MNDETTTRPDCEFILRGDYNDCAHAGGGRGAPLGDWCKPCLVARAEAAERDDADWKDLADANRRERDKAADQAQSHYDHMRRVAGELAEARRDRDTARWKALDAIVERAEAAEAERDELRARLQQHEQTDSKEEANG